MFFRARRSNLFAGLLPVHGRRALLFATEQVAQVAHGLIQTVDENKEQLM